MKEELNAWSEMIFTIMTSVWSKVAGFIPNLIAALIILVIGYFVARFIGFLLARILNKIGFDSLTSKVGVTEVLKKSGIKLNPSDIIGALGFWIIMLTFLVTATESLGLPRVSATIDEVVLYLPRVIAAAIIIIVGLFLANFLRDLVRSSAESVGLAYAKPLATAAYAVLFVVILSLSVNQLEIETELLNWVLSILVAAAGLALALSLGLGSRELSSNLIAGFYARDLFTKGARIIGENCDGKVDSIGTIKTVIVCEDGSKQTVPNVELMTRSVSIEKK